MFGMSREDRAKLDSAVQTSNQALTLIEGHLRECAERDRKRDSTDKEWRDDARGVAQRLSNGIDAAVNKVSETKTSVSRLMLTIAGMVILQLIGALGFVIASYVLPPARNGVLQQPPSAYYPNGGSYDRPNQRDRE